MSGQVFEYFFDPAELEPYYSELPRSMRPVRIRRDEADAVISLPTSTSRDAAPTLVVSPTAVEEDSPSNIIETQVASGSPDDAPSCGVQATEPAKTSVQQSTVDPPRKPVDNEPRTVNPGRTRVRQLLSVHALGQYVFCHRSAILAVERGDQQDVDEPLPRLTYLPNFDRERIEELLKRRLGELGLSTLLSVSMICLILAGTLGQNKGLVYPALFALIACLMWFSSLTVTIFQLAIRRQAAIRAEAREPDPQIIEIQKVSWWAMLKAGFEPVNYLRPFQHPELPLEGCPWRVLERDSVRIPVIRSGGDKLGSRKGQLYGKHQIRLVAYALLLEAIGYEVPYGLVFPRDSAVGLAMPITGQLRAQTRHTLQEFVRKLRESQQRHIEPNVPENRQRCAHCPHGQPKAIRAHEIEHARKSGNRVVVLLNASNRAFHCDCGDRFGTVPPHDDSIRLGLRPAL